jgi:hypothetical protein
MNRHGLILTDVGFGPMLQELTARIAAPLGAELFPDWIGPARLFPDGAGRFTDVPDETAETYGFIVRCTGARIATWPRTVVCRILGWLPIYLPYS